MTKRVCILSSLALAACGTSDSTSSPPSGGPTLDATVIVGDTGASGSSSGSTSGGASGSVTSGATGGGSGASSGAASGSSTGSGGSGVGSGSSLPEAGATETGAQDAGAADSGATAPPSAVAAVWTNRYDNARSGAALTETILTPATVGSGKFGLLFSLPVDGTVQAQPLYVPALTIQGKVHNTVFVASEHNTVYAYDADAAGPALWTASLGPAAPSNASIYGCLDLFPEVGVNATPVIDLATNTLYVLGKTLEGTARHQRLHALDLLSGAERSGSPVEIAPSAPGTGAGSTGGVIAFDPNVELSRPALLLEGGVVYAAFSSHCDVQLPYHGWVVGYDAKTLALRGAYVNTPNGSQGGIWQSGMGLSSDGTGVYFVSGNGTFDATGAHRDTGLSVGRLTLTDAGLGIADFYTPFNAAALNVNDNDLTSAAVIGVGTPYLFMSGKDSQMRVLNRSNLGGFHAGGDQIVQNVDLGGGHVHGGPVFWTGATGPTMFVWPEGHALRAYGVTAGGVTVPAKSTANIGFNPVHPGGMVVVSSNGTKPRTGVVWGTSVTVSAPYDAAWHGIVPGRLYAFDAEDLTKNLWNSDQIATDTLGMFAKFSAPTVANGKVYVTTANGTAGANAPLRVYGLHP